MKLITISDPLTLILFGFRAKSVIYNQIISVSATKGMWNAWMNGDDWRGIIRRLIIQRWLKIQ